MLFLFHGLNVVFVCVLARHGNPDTMPTYSSLKKTQGATLVPKCQSVLSKRHRALHSVPKCQSVLSKRHRALHSYPSAKVFCQKDTGRYTCTQVPKRSVKMAELINNWNSQSGVNKVTHSRLWQWFLSVSN